MWRIRSDAAISEKVELKASVMSFDMSEMNPTVSRRKSGFPKRLNFLIFGSMELKNLLLSFVAVSFKRALKNGLLRLGGVIGNQASANANPFAFRCVPAAKLELAVGGNLLVDVFRFGGNQIEFVVVNRQSPERAHARLVAVGGG